MAAFPSIDEIKTALGIDPADTDSDDAIETMLASTMAIVESYLGCGIQYASQSQEFDPPDSDNASLCLWRFPVASVESVAFDNGQAVVGYRLFKQPGILRWRSRCLCLPHWCCDYAPVL